MQGDNTWWCNRLTLCNETAGFPIDSHVASMLAVLDPQSSTCSDIILLLHGVYTGGLMSRSRRFRVLLIMQSPWSAAGPGQQSTGCLVTSFKPPPITGRLLKKVFSKVATVFDVRLCTFFFKYRRFIVK